MKYKKEQIYGAVGSLLFGFLLIIFLYLIGIKANLPDNESGGGGIEVNFGNLEFASGNEEPSYMGEDKTSYNQNGTAEGHSHSSKDEISPKNRGKEYSPSVRTQNIEKTIALPLYKKSSFNGKSRVQQEKTTGLKNNENTYAKKREEINKQMAGSFGAGSFHGGSEGTESEGKGNQGSLQGNSSRGPYHGTGGKGGGRGNGNGKGYGSGSGNGIGSFSLAGRTIGRNGLPKPAYTAQEEGRIVVNITVNPQGLVIFAKIGRGTDIDNESMRSSALSAARRATFNVIAGSNNQSGTITYKYKLN